MHYWGMQHLINNHFTLYSITKLTPKLQNSTYKVEMTHNALVKPVKTLQRLRIHTFCLRAETHPKREKEMSSSSPFIIFYSTPECLTQLQISSAPPPLATVVVSTSGEEPNSLRAALFWQRARSASHSVR